MKLLRRPIFPVPWLRHLVQLHCRMLRELLEDLLAMPHLLVARLHRNRAKEFGLTPLPILAALGKLQHLSILENEVLPEGDAA